MAYNPQAQQFYNYMDRKSEQMHFVLFINTKSGDGYGSNYLKLGGNQITIKYEGGKKAHLFLFDLFSNQSRKSGFQLVLSLYGDANVDCRVVICGGDGTIPWVLSELLAIGIDLTKIVIGIIPIGTGNDFSRSIGWGTTPVKISPNNFKSLGALVRQWMNSTVGYYDMWDVQVETFDNGSIWDVKDQREIQRKEKGFKKMFSNYVGMGLDAKVVYTVERHRTSIAFFNKVVYGFIGFLNFFRHMKKLEETVKAIVQYQAQDDFQEKQFSTKRKRSILDQNLIPESSVQYPLKPGYCGIVCLNCTSYMAGLRKVWQTKTVSVPNVRHNSFSQQKVDDGLIEFVSFKTELNLALERIMRSGARAMQGKGPFQILMKEPVGDEITYMQIDGESIKLKNLKSIRISKTDKISDHRLRVMVNKNAKE